MPHCSLRQYLSKANPPIQIQEDAVLSQGRSDTAAQSLWHTVEDARLWKDFNIHAINELLGHILDLEFELPNPPPLPENIFPIRLKRSFEFIITLWNTIIINGALKKVCDHLQLPSVQWIPDPSTENSKHEIKTFPDWCGMVRVQGHDRTIVPGDSKLLDSYLPRDISSVQQELDSDDLPLSSPPTKDQKKAKSWLEQCTYYSAIKESRYGFLITPREAILFRRTSSTYVHTPLANHRRRRQAPRSSPPDISEDNAQATCRLSESPSPAGNPIILQSPSSSKATLPGSDQLVGSKDSIEVTLDLHETSQKPQPHPNSLHRLSVPILHTTQMDETKRFRLSNGSQSPGQQPLNWLWT